MRACATFEGGDGPTLAITPTNDGLNDLYLWCVAWSKTPDKDKNGSVTGVGDFEYSAFVPLHVKQDVPYLLSNESRGFTVKIGQPDTVYVRTTTQYHYQWMVCDDEKIYTTGEFEAHAVVEGIDRAVCTFTPSDTWLDGKRIFCAVTSDAGKVVYSPRRRITIDADALITIQPRKVDTYCGGTFTYAITAPTGISFEWKVYSGKTGEDITFAQIINNSSSTATLTLMSEDYAYGTDMQLHCIVTDANGRTEDSAYVPISYQRSEGDKYVVFTSQPQEGSYYELSAGETLYLSCDFENYGVNSNNHEYYCDWHIQDWGALAGDEYDWDEVREHAIVEGEDTRNLSITPIDDWLDKKFIWVEGVHVEETLPDFYSSRHTYDYYRTESHVVSVRMKRDAVDLPAQGTISTASESGNNYVHEAILAQPAGALAGMGGLLNYQWQTSADGALWADRGAPERLGRCVPAEEEAGLYLRAVVTSDLLPGSIETNAVKIVQPMRVITFDPNGGSGAMESVRVLPGLRYTLPENGFTAPAGKQFYGWNIHSGIEAENGRNYFVPGDEVLPIADVTVLPLWLDTPQAPESVTLIFQPGTGTGTAFEQTGEYGSEYTAQRFTMPECPFTPPEHQVFHHWRGEWIGDGGVTQYANYGAGEKVFIPARASSGMKLTAVYVPEERYIVKYKYFNTDDTTYFSELHYAGETATGPAADPIRDTSVYNWTFTGWYTDLEHTILYDFSTPITRDVTLYAGWAIPEDAPTWTITLSPGEGSTTLTRTEKVVQGEKYILSDQWGHGFSAPGGKEFASWDAGMPGDEIEVTGDTTITALWADRPEVTFTKDSAAVAGGAMEVDVDAMAAVSYPLKLALEQGRVTYEWWVGSVHTDNTTSRIELKSGDLYSTVYLFMTYDCGTPGMNDANRIVNLSKSFIVKPAVCHVDFYTADGTPVPDQYVPNGQFAAPPTAIPTWENHAFLGWYAEPWGDAHFDFAAPITDNTTVYAHWKDLTEYAITVAPTEHGTVAVSHAKAAGDTQVTVTITPDPGYIVASAAYEVGVVGYGSIGKGGAFTMPYADITIKVTFKQPVEGVTEYLVLPDALKTLEADAFAGIAAKAVVIPASVTDIQGDPFAGSAVAYIVGQPASAAETFAAAYGYTFVPLTD